MMREFSINMKGSLALPEQYEMMYGQFCSERFLPNHGNRYVVYDVKPEYGTGTIQLCHLLDHVRLLLYDLTFTQDISTVFELNQDYFEIEYCVGGCMLIEEEEAGGTCFSANQLSVSLSRDTKGVIKYCAGQQYQGISITSSKNTLSAFFGSSGMGIWNDTIEKLGESLRTRYYLGQQAYPETADAFCQIYHCRLPVKTRILYYESKVMEVLSQIISGELVKEGKQDPAMLSPYELARIKEVPEMLLQQPFELPSLSALSQTLSMSQKKLVKGFKLVYGDTVYSYYRKLALKRAAAMLLETEKPVNEIAYDSGYSTPSNFCAAFKKQYKLTPLKYREASLLRCPPVN